MYKHLLSGRKFHLSSFNFDIILYIYINILHRKDINANYVFIGERNNILI